MRHSDSDVRCGARELGRVLLLFRSRVHRQLIRSGSTSNSVSRGSHTVTVAGRVE